jgi:hypothetical protein
MSKNATRLRNHSTGEYVIFNDAGALVNQDGDSVGGSGGTLETPAGAVDGVNDTYTFTGPPTLIFRNGVMENDLGSIVGSTFVYDSAPATGTMRGLV